MNTMSTRNTKTTPRRSSSLRNSTHNTVPGLASYNRPRSSSFLFVKSPSAYNNNSPSPTIFTFHSFIGVPSVNSSSNYNSSYSLYNNYPKKYNASTVNGYSTYNGYGEGSNYSVPQSLNNNHSSYGSSLSSGYGSLAVPSRALSALNIIHPYSGVTARDYTQASKPVNNVYSVGGGTDKGRKSRSRSRNGSFARSRSTSGVRDSGMASRSTSLSSLNSEGYVSGSESRSGSRSSRLGPASELATLRGENGELDYKKMYEQATADNDRLKDKLRKSEEELRDTKTTLEKLQTVTSKNSLSELEKRERRAMERKLSEMEEELKQLQKLKAENERLRAENRALTRVVSKLTNSPGK